MMINIVPIIIAIHAPNTGINAVIAVNTDINNGYGNLNNANTINIKRTISISIIFISKCIDRKNITKDNPIPAMSNPAN